MTFASKSQAAIDQTIKDLSQPFKLRDLGPTTQLLGIKIDWDRSKHSITISQKQYCLDVLERFGMADCKPLSTPMQPNLRLSRSQCPHKALLHCQLLRQSTLQQYQLARRLDG